MARRAHPWRGAMTRRATPPRAVLQPAVRAAPCPPGSEGAAAEAAPEAEPEAKPEAEAEAVPRCAQVWLGRRRGPEAARGGVAPAGRDAVPSLVRLRHRHLLHRLALPCPGLGHMLHRAGGGQQDAHRARQHRRVGRPRHARRRSCPRAALPPASRPPPVPRRLCNPRHAPASPRTTPAAPVRPARWQRSCHSGPRAPPTLTPTRSARQAGLACLVGCLCCATAYRPAPLRRTEHEHEQASTPDTRTRASRHSATCLQRLALRRTFAYRCGRRSLTASTVGATRPTRKVVIKLAEKAAGRQPQLSSSRGTGRSWDHI